jgi:hypothetical protein
VRRHFTIDFFLATNPTIWRARCSIFYPASKKFEALPCHKFFPGKKELNSNRKKWHPAL